MEPERIGNLIKKLREERNLTQKEFADEYGVSYQAVSKWERGINIPDISILREICRNYHLSIDEILDGNIKEKKRFPWWTLLVLVVFVLLVVVFLHAFKSPSYQFKTLSSTCDAFKVTGSLAYDQKKSSIYISSIDYCGGDDLNSYEKVECSLFEKGENGIQQVGRCETKEHITLEEYLKQVEIKNSDYSSSCKNYSDDSLYLEIHAYKENYKSVVYKIPLSLNSTCAQ